MDLWGEILLLVEGDDEVGFFIKYIQHLLDNDPELWGNLPKIQIIPLDGKENFKLEFKALSSQTAFRDVVRIGIIQDADDDSNRAFQSSCSKLRTFNYIPPNDQLSYSDSIPSFVILINPSEGKGMFEDIVLSDQP